MWSKFRNLQTTMYVSLVKHSLLQNLVSLGPNAYKFCIRVFPTGTIALRGTRESEYAKCHEHLPRIRTLEKT